MIYLFCNLGYGQNFITELVKYSAENNIQPTIVISTKRKNSKVGFLKLIKNKYKELLLKRDIGLNVMLIDNVNSISFNNKINKNDIAVISGFNQIFKKNTIDSFNTIVNFHPSVLPYYKGPVPSYWCIKNQEKATGYTLHKVTESIDDGEILFQELINIDKNISEKLLDEKISKKASVVFTQFIDCIINKNTWVKKQLDASEVYTKKINYLSFPL